MKNAIIMKNILDVHMLPAQVECMRQVLRAGALGRPRGMVWGGKRDGEHM